VPLAEGADALHVPHERRTPIADIARVQPLCFHTERQQVGIAGTEAVELVELVDADAGVFRDSADFLIAQPEKALLFRLGCKPGA
jgi:hypothetical protein